MKVKNTGPAQALVIASGVYFLLGNQDSVVQIILEIMEISTIAIDLHFWTECKIKLLMSFSKGIFKSEDKEHLSDC